MFHRLQSVVNVQLGSHLDESEGVYATHKSVYNKGVPALVLVVYNRVNCVENHHWEESVRHVIHCDTVVLFSFTLSVRFFVF